jgi:hypothetical protein
VQHYVTAVNTAEPEPEFRVREARISGRLTQPGTNGGMRTMFVHIICFVASLLMFGALGRASAAPEIEWRVENPFRFFVEAKDSEVHRATFLALSQEERATPVLSAERALAERHPDGWASTMYRHICWDAAHNRHVCSAYSDYINPKSHIIISEIKGLDPNDPGTCTWLTAPLAAVGRGTAVNAPCDKPVRLEIPYPQGSRITVEIDGQLIGETEARVQDLLIVGMGDSFASGEGNPDIPVRFSRERAADYGKGNAEGDLVGYPARVGAWRKIGDQQFIDENARWIDQACHRSLYSYQLRAALQLAIEEPHRAVTFAGVACSGAETTFGLFLRYKGSEWVPNPPELSQMSTLADVQCGKHEARAYDLPEAYHMGEKIPELKGGLVLRKCDPDKARKVDLLLLSIGGNDIGFSRLVANAVLADQSSLRRLGGWFGQVYGFQEAIQQLEKLDVRYKSANRAIHNILHVPWGEADRIFLTGYPPLAVLEDGKSMCPDGRAGMDVLPDFNLSEVKAREGTTAAERLHAIMRDAAHQHNWTFIEAHRKSFLGRGICAGWSSAAFNSADDLRLPRKINGEWDPINPADWRPYVSRQRWFRTPNDAFMTGNFHVSQSLLQNVLKTQTLSWVQLLLASIYSGAFHPTAEGQAAIADAVVDKAREVLKKYESAHRLDQ